MLFLTLHNSPRITLNPFLFHKTPAKDCGWFGPIENWNSTLAPDANNTLYNAVALVTCARGYVMTSGSDRLVLLCNEHGNWSQTIPTCER